jgi:hypothetical protein
MTTIKTATAKDKALMAFSHRLSAFQGRFEAELAELVSALQDALQTAAPPPAPAPPPGDMADRSARMQAFQDRMRQQGLIASHRSIRRSAIYFSAKKNKNVTTPSTKFYLWLSGSLSDTSHYSKAIERVLQGELPLKFACRVRASVR